MKQNQRESGRWWTRSLNNDSSHFITYSGTAYPLLALGLCGELPTRPAPPLSASINASLTVGALTQRGLDVPVLGAPGSFESSTR